MGRPPKRGMATLPHGKPLVYALAMGRTRFVKIGVTAEAIDKRVASLQTGNPFRLAFFWFRFGWIDHERAMHDYFAERRREGEWFDFDGIPNARLALNRAWIQSGASLIPQPFDDGNRWFEEYHQEVKDEDDRREALRRAQYVPPPVPQCVMCKKAPAVKGTVRCVSCGGNVLREVS